MRRPDAEPAAGGHDAQLAEQDVRPETLFALHALINLAMAMSLLPTKGLTLPFLSYGGSSLLVNSMAAGILLNISRHAEARAEAESPAMAEVAA